MNKLFIGIKVFTWVLLTVKPVFGPHTMYGEYYHGVTGGRRATSLSDEGHSPIHLISMIVV